MGIFCPIIKFLKPESVAGIAGIWNDEHELVDAAKAVRAQGFTKFDAVSPFPLHGIDEAIGISRSWIPYVCFGFGLFGASFGTWFTWWVSASNWPMNIGGKPMWSLPAFIPVIFECAILFAALSSVATMILVNGLPNVAPKIIDADLTSHRFALFIPENDHGYDAEKVEALLKSLGAADVRRTEF